MIMKQNLLFAFICCLGFIMKPGVNVFCQATVQRSAFDSIYTAQTMRFSEDWMGYSHAIYRSKEYSTRIVGELGGQYPSVQGEYRSFLRNHTAANYCVGICVASIIGAPLVGAKTNSYQAYMSISLVGLGSLIAWEIFELSARSHFSTAIWNYNRESLKHALSAPDSIK